MSDPRWDPLFEDLEHQFAAEREAEHGQLAAETERLRVARLGLRDRLLAAGTGARVTIEDRSGGAHRLRLEAVGADWVAGRADEPAGLLIARIDAVDGVVFAAADRQRSIGAVDDDPLRARMGFGFVLRVLARRRAHIALGLVRGGRVSGTPARAGADHVDVAIHDAGSSPRGSEVRQVRTLAFRAIAWVRTAARGDVGLI
ncbi:hypothetical protein [Microbacterium karelineae]|uniref:hypothetical protein n=1 Tax=Microbacterium karelineae TaxID=2654283 RepID=UPI0012E9F4AC|nr:hypothetical protein [Microbacterium karelineae]